MASSIPEPRALKSVSDFLKIDKFDYLIVGGGTAGLTVAARLTEDPRVVVGVVEAGLAKLNDPTILTPGAFPQMLENPEYDWSFRSEEQVSANID